MATQEGDEETHPTAKMASSSWPLDKYLQPDLGVCLCTGLLVGFLTINGI